MKPCRHVARRRRLFADLRAYKARVGCALCGYCACPEALDFHHSDNPDHPKRFAVNTRMKRRPPSEIWSEVQRTLVLCATCHREVTAGYTDLRHIGRIS